MLRARSKQTRESNNYRGGNGLHNSFVMKGPRAIAKRPESLLKKSGPTLYVGPDARACVSQTPKTQASIDTESRVHLRRFLLCRD